MELRSWRMKGTISVDDGQGPCQTGRSADQRPLRWVLLGVMEVQGGTGKAGALSRRKGGSDSCRAGLSPWLAGRYEI